MISSFTRRWSASAFGILLREDFIQVHLVHLLPHQQIDHRAAGPEVAVDVHLERAVPLLGGQLSEVLHGLLGGDDRHHALGDGQVLAQLAFAEADDNVFAFALDAAMAEMDFAAAAQECAQLINLWS